MPYVASIGTYLPCWGTPQRRVPGDDEDAITIAVEDNGPGPEAAQRPLLFDPFFSGRTAGRGRGLGLPIAWRLAHLQGGDVRLELLHLGAEYEVLAVAHRGDGCLDVGGERPVLLPQVEQRHLHRGPGLSRGQNFSSHGQRAGS